MAAGSSRRVLTSLVQEPLSEQPMHQASSEAVLSLWLSAREFPRKGHGEEGLFLFLLSLGGLENWGGVLALSSRMWLCGSVGSRSPSV